MPARILLVDDYENIRASLRSLVEKEDDLPIVAEADNVTGIVDLGKDGEEKLPDGGNVSLGPRETICFGGCVDEGVNLPVKILATGADRPKAASRGMNGRSSCFQTDATSLSIGLIRPGRTLRKVHRRLLCFA